MSIAVADPVSVVIDAWARTNAFLEPGEHATLVDYDPSVNISWKDGIPAPASYWDAIARPSSSLGI